MCVDCVYWLSNGHTPIGHNKKSNDIISDCQNVILKLERYWLCKMVNVTQYLDMQGISNRH